MAYVRAKREKFGIPDQTRHFPRRSWFSTGMRNPKKKPAGRIPHIVDETDRRLLTELSNDARRTFRELSRAVGLSQSAVAERVKTLESMGVIRGYPVDLDLAQLGYPMLAFIRMDTDGEKCKRLQRDIPSIPEVLECHRVAGGGSSILRVALRSVAHLEEVVDKLLAYGNPTTSLVLSTTVERRTVKG